MRFFIPEWDDRVDPGYDFSTDSHSAMHNANPMENDSYMWDIFEKEKVPFDGVLVSIANLQQNTRKYKSILDKGIHSFLGLPQDFQILADCGAFSYIDQEIPPYKTSDVLKIYSDLDFNYGVSIDHLVVPMHKEKNKQRIEITFKNGVEAHNEWKNKYKEDFQLIVAVQGAEIRDYLLMFNKFYKNGIRHFAFGGLVRTQTTFIIQLIEALIEDINKTKKKPELIHFFGVARYSLFSKFKELDDMGISTSFDSSSHLRKAWLTSAHTEFNYIDQSWTGYSAIRIPSKLTKEKLEFIDPDEYASLSNDCLNSLRKFDDDEISLKKVMEKLKKFIERMHEDPELLKYYQRTLESKPWKQCSCPICKEIKIDVVIFRGNNRNRRRGFHNVFVFNEILKDKAKWERCKKKELEKQIRSLERTNLDFLKGKENVLVITGCSKNKLTCEEGSNGKVMAKELYQGTLFKKVRAYAEAMHFDYRIISAKHGLITPEFSLETYDQRLNTICDVEKIRPNVEIKLKQDLIQYDTIAVIAGDKYRLVLGNLVNNKFRFIKAKGIGDMIQIVSKAVPKNKKLAEFVD
ncbi:tRNA-guanine transglycosylase DpdA [Methanoregula sp.]|uniref:tRNA-guanine transglycosylase DpdA n=1 Tax=Methanoregula sp. TaxID=2052170 RepID=UPI00356908D3